MVWCSHCFNDCLTEFDPKNGYISCTDCGKILDDVEYYDGQDEGDAPFSAKDTSDTGNQAADRPDYSKTHVLSDTSSDEEDNLSDIDDAEALMFGCVWACLLFFFLYLHNEKEMCYKTMIWEAMNKEYLEEKATKVAVAAVAKRSDASKNLTKERKCRGSDIASGQSASEATDKVVDRKRHSSKINYEALNKLIPVGVEKKPRTESYTGIQTGDCTTFNSYNPVGVEKKPGTESYTDIQTGDCTTFNSYNPVGVEKKPRTESYTGIQTGVEGNKKTESYTVDVDGGAEGNKETKSFTVNVDGIQTGIEGNKKTESYTVDDDGGVEGNKKTESYTVDDDGGAEGNKETKSFTVNVDGIQTGIEVNENVFYSAGEGDEAVNYEDDDYGHYWDPHENYANNEEFDEGY